MDNTEVEWWIRIREISTVSAWIIIWIKWGVKCERFETTEERRKCMYKVHWESQEAMIGGMASQERSKETIILLNCICRHTRKM